jgi:hypothetical protein
VNQPPYQQSPPPQWGQPRQPPAWGAPPPPPPRRQIPAFAIAAIATFVIAALVALANLGGDSKDHTKPAAKPPHYEIVKQDTSGNARNVEVEVNSTTNLRAVFDAVTKRLTDEAGYSIVINCSTGGTARVDNRLANGKYAVGRMGAASTGLKDGGTEFSTNAGQSCPAKK